jgi:hypothetical protein
MFPNRVMLLAPHHPPLPPQQQQQQQQQHSSRRSTTSTPAAVKYDTPSGPVSTDSQWHDAALFDHVHDSDTAGRGLVAGLQQHLAASLSGVWHSLSHLRPPSPLPPGPPSHHHTSPTPPPGFDFTTTAATPHEAHIERPAGFVGSSGKRGGGRRGNKGKKSAAAADDTSRGSSAHESGASTSPPPPAQRQGATSWVASRVKYNYCSLQARQRVCVCAHFFAGAADCCSYPRLFVSYVNHLTCTCVSRASERQKQPMHRHRNPRVACSSQDVVLWLSDPTPASLSSHLLNILRSASPGSSTSTAAPEITVRPRCVDQQH